ncbi:HTTM domain-containing protein [Tamlana sp. 62-3]|uniref:HTTM domain-containing protein n=1 Tax=Neotamlana sargassicola TaxID=2883125 RepID=A0A9X1I405_9FLAO|nr:HTTM domain-containing protein [Tamlana sargassicola]MCB4807465.1 HTTM domain-containing protein [Tamlana sargassicola]
MLKSFLFKHIDNSALIVFRICFGLLCFLESVGAIFTGWVRVNLVTPKFTFSFIGFEWLQPLPGNGMYFYYALMGIFGLLVMLGYKYRLAIISFTLMWTASYLMQKTSYNNHYYLLILISSIMVFMPAHKYASLDAKINPKIKSNAMPQWCKWVIVLQLFIVYTYASLAKFYPDWLNTTFIANLMSGKADYPLVGPLLQQKWFHYTLTYGGILFDGLVVPLLLFKPTRKFIFIVSIIFHLFNSFVLQIGIFPYLALAFTLFFFEAETIQNLFLKKKPLYNSNEIIIPKSSSFFIAIFSVYFIVQIGLPLRHHFFKDDVLWTEEGHRLSWRMMLRSKSGIISYHVENKTTGERIRINLNHYLTKKQKRKLAIAPDAIWQFAQHLKQEFKAKNQDIEVYVTCRVSVNRKPYKMFINPKVDLANVEWQPLKHSDWILPYKPK